MALGAMVLVSSCGAVVSSDGGPASSTAKAGGSGLPAKVTEKGKLVVAIGHNTVPTHFIKGGKLVGFNVDISRALSKQLGVKLELRQVPFDSVLAGIAAGRYDTALYNVSDSPKRRKVVNFVDYALSGSVVVTAKGNPAGLKTDPMSLCGHKIGMTAGLYEFEVLSKKSKDCAGIGKKPIDISTYDSDSTVDKALVTGRIEGFVDGLTATPYMVSHHSDKFQLIGKLPIAAGPLGMPFAKERSPQLLRAVKHAWETLLHNGEYARIAKKWEESRLVPKKITFNNGDGLA